MASSGNGSKGALEITNEGDMSSSENYSMDGVEKGRHQEWDLVPEPE